MLSDQEIENLDNLQDGIFESFSNIPYIAGDFKALIDLVRDSFKDRDVVITFRCLIHMWHANQRIQDTH